MQAYKAILIKNFELPAEWEGFKGSVCEEEEMVPPVGIEPTTYGLQNRCSAN